MYSTLHHGVAAVYTAILLFDNSGENPPSLPTRRPIRETPLRGLLCGSLPCNRCRREGAGWCLLDYPQSFVRDKPTSACAHLNLATIDQNVLFPLCTGCLNLLKSIELIPSGTDVCSSSLLTSLLCRPREGNCRVGHPCTRFASESTLYPGFAACHAR